MVEPTPYQAPYRTQWIDLTGAHNVRDIGGLTAGPDRVRTGVLLRSDNLDQLTDADLAVLHEEIGLRAVIDLRTDAEAPAPPEWIAPLGMNRLHLPLVDLSGTTRPGGLREQFAQDIAVAYASMLDEAAPGIARILTYLVEADHVPAIIHCAAGKDRTGISIAVLLAAAGVDEPGIVADYVATGERLMRVRAALSVRDMYKSLGDAPPEFEIAPRGIESVLTALREFDGGAEGFLIAQGTTRDELARWRELIIEPATS